MEIHNVCKVILGINFALGEPLATDSSGIHVSPLEWDTCIIASPAAWCVGNIAAVSHLDQYIFEGRVVDKLVSCVWMINA